jgi:tetratricopeptide (TPR) repeat protein
MAHFQMGKHRAALRDLEAGLERSAGHPFRPLFQGALAWTFTNCKESKLRDPSRGLEAAEAAIAVDPNQARAWCALGWARLRTAKDPKAATEAFDRARELAEQGDEDLGACYGLAIAHIRLDAADDAAAWLEKARAFAEENPKDAQEFDHLRLEAEAAVDLQRR